MTPNKTKFDKLAKLEPRLLDVLASAKKLNSEARAKNRVCANAMWYGDSADYGLKDKVGALIGWYRSKREYNRVRKPIDVGSISFAPRPMSILTTPPPPRPTGLLFSEEAYDVAYDYIYAALPDCKNCGCFGVQRTA